MLKHGELIDQQILSISRHGKMLQFQLSNHRYILSHLGMTGAWIIHEGKRGHKHDHLSFTLEVEDKHFKVKRKKPRVYLTYHDPRRFGHMYYYGQQEMSEYMKRLGRDLLDPSFDLAYLKKCLLKSPDRAIKVALLDQRYFAGSGNYIANEICGYAKVLPYKLCKDLSGSEIAKILRSIKRVLAPAVAAGGVTFQGGYQDTYGSKGKGVQGLKVFYQKRCGHCKKTAIVKFQLQGRGTYYCPSCQK